MKRMTMKGGDQNTIEGVLGEPLREIVGSLKAGGSDASFFKCKNAKSRPRGADGKPAADDDISPLFFQFFTSVIREINWMESPDTTKPSFTGKEVQEKLKTVTWNLYASKNMYPSWKS